MPLSQLINKGYSKSQIVDAYIDMNPSVSSLRDKGYTDDQLFSAITDIEGDGSLERGPATPKEISSLPIYQEPETRSAVGEIATGLKRGVMVDTPVLMGDALKYTGQPGDTLYDVGQSIKGSAIQREQDNPGSYKLHPENHNTVTNALAQGATMIPASIGLPAAVGIAIDAAPVEIPAAVGLGLASVATGAVFGASQGQQTYENVKNAGGSEEDAHKAGMIAGAIEWGGESIANLLELKYLGKAFKAFGGDKATGKTAKAVLGKIADPKAMRTFLLDALKTNAGEVSTEFGQNYGERAVEQNYGVTGQSPLDAGLAAIPATIGMGVLTLPFAGLSHAKAFANNRKLVGALQDPDSPKSHRIAAAAWVVNQIKAADPAVAKEWSKAAGLAIQSNEPINIGQPKPIQEPVPQDDSNISPEMPNEVNQAPPTGTVDQGLHEFQDTETPISKKAVAVSNELGAFQAKVTGQEQAFDQDLATYHESLMDHDLPVPSSQTIAQPRTTETPMVKGGIIPTLSMDEQLDKLGDDNIVNTTQVSKTILRKSPKGQAVVEGKSPKVVYKKTFKSEKGAHFGLKVRIKKGLLKAGDYDVVPVANGFQIQTITPEQRAARNKIPHDLRDAIKVMTVDVQDGEVGKRFFTDDHVTGMKSTFPDWFKSYNPKIDKRTGLTSNYQEWEGNWSKAEFENLVSKLEKGRQLTTKEQSRADELFRVAKYYNKTNSELADGRLIDSLQDKGFDILGKKMPAGKVNPGDQVVFDDSSDIYTAHDDKDGLRFEDGITRVVDPFEMLKVDAIKREEQSTLDTTTPEAQSSGQNSLQTTEDKPAKEQTGQGRQSNKTSDILADKQSAAPTKKEVDAAAHEAATSPKNNIPQPTEAMKEAGNYKVGKIKLHGLDISIENPKGSKRSGTDKSGTPWSITMKSHYGYVKNSLGPDKDHVDVFLGSKANDESLPVYVVDQVDPKTGKYDEPKVVMGASSEEEARKLYLSNYEKGWKGIGAVTPMSLDKFKEWVHDKKKTVKPVGKIKKSLTPTSAKIDGNPTIIADIGQAKDKSSDVLVNGKAYKLKEYTVSGEKKRTIVTPDGQELTQGFDSTGKVYYDEAYGNFAKDGSGGLLEFDEDKIADVFGEVLKAVKKGSTKQTTDKQKDKQELSSYTVDKDEVKTGDVGRELSANKRNRYIKGLTWEDIADKEAALKVKEIKKKETDNGVAMYSRKTDLTSKSPKDTIDHGQITEQAETIRRKLAKDFNKEIPKGTITEVHVRGNNAPTGRVPSPDASNSIPRRRSDRSSLSGVEVAKRVAKLFRKKIVFFKDSFGLGVDGAHFSGDTIYINVDANNPYLAITGHELLHSLRKDNPELYAQLYPVIMQEMKVSEFKKYKDWLSLKTVQEGRGIAENDLVIEEMAANFLGDQMMEPAFWAKVQGHSPTLFDKVSSYIKQFLTKFKKRLGLRGLRSSEYFRDLGKVQDAMAKAVAGYGEAQKWHMTRGLQLPKMRGTTNDSGTKILTEDDIVKENNSSTYSRQHVSTLIGARNKVEQIIEDAGLSEKFEKVATYLWDKDIAISKVQKELPNQPEARDYNLIRRLMGKRMADETQIFDETRLKPLLKNIADAGLSIQDVEELAYAQHVPERNLQMKRVNARRYLDSIISYMTDAEATDWKNRIIDIDDKFMANDGSIDISGKRDAYIDLVAKLENSLEGAKDGLGVMQKELAGRAWTDKETLNGTPERLQSRLDNEQKRIDNRTNIIDKWNDVKDRLSGMTNEEAGQVVSDWKSKPNFEQNQKATDDLRKIGSDALDMVYSAGELSEDEYKNIKGAYKYHVPLYREDMDSRKAATGRAGAGPLASPIKLASGSTRTVVDIFAHVIDNYQSAISRKHKLEAGKILYEMVKDNPDETRWSIEEQDKIPYMDKEGNIRFYPDQKEDDNEVYIKVSGVKHLISVPKDNNTMMRWMEAVKRTPVELGPILKASQKVNRFLAQLNTSFSPEFLVTNFLRDIQTAGIHLEDMGEKGTIVLSTKTKSGEITAAKRGFKKHQVKIFKNIPAAIKGIFLAESKKGGGEWGTWYKDFSANGGKISWMQGYENVQELAKNIEKELAYKAGKHPKKKQFKDFLDFIGATNTAVENGVRLATYRHLVSELGISKRKAAHIVANLTVDFTRHGTAGPIINSLWMFANAGIQGNARMITALSRNNKVRKIAGGIVAFGFAANIIGAMSGGDDDDGESFYDKLKRAKPYLFERNMIFMIPGTAGEYFKIPMPYGYNLFFIAGNEAASAVRMVNGYSAAEGMGRIMGSFLNTFNPIGAATVLQTLSPTVTDPIVQSMENKAWHGGDLMPAPNPYGQPKPDSERYWKSVNPGAKLAAKALNRITGGNSIEPGVFDISPETIENLVENYTGSLGRFIKDSVSLPFKEDIGARDIPFMRKLFGSSSNYADSKIYRINRDKVEIARRKLKAARSMKERLEIRRNRISGMSLRTKIVERKLKDLRRRLTLAEDRGNTARAEVIKDKILQVQRSYNKRFNSTVYQ